MTSTNRSFLWKIVKTTETINDTTEQCLFFFRAAPIAYGNSQVGVKLELQLPAYATAKATQDLSHICDFKMQINKWNLIKHKLLHSKRNHKQNEKTTYRLGENICKFCANNSLISKIYKQIIQFNNRGKKWAEGLNRHFAKGDLQMANRHFKRCSSLLIIRKCKLNKTTRHCVVAQW